MSSDIGVLHCERCDKPFTLPKELLMRKAEDEFEESKQAGYCSPKCLYEQDSEEEEQKFVEGYINNIRT
jgi:hypothetical protein